MNLPVGTHSLGVAVLVLLITSLSGCGGQPQRPSAHAQQAIEANQRGLRLLAKGQHQAALSQFQQALRHAEAIEDNDAIAANLLNSANALRRLGRSAEAERLLQRLLDESSITYPRDHRVDGAMQLSLIALQQGRPGSARQWWQKAHAWCARDCQHKPRLLTLSAHLALAQADTAAALSAARQAVALQRQGNDQQGLADALRSLGLALLASQQPDAALAPLQEALTIDKRQGIPQALAKDLIALARAHQALAEHDKARQHYQRAERVARAAGDQALLRQIQQEIAR